MDSQTKAILIFFVLPVLYASMRFYVIWKRNAPQPPRRRPAQQGGRRGR